MKKNNQKITEDKMWENVLDGLNEYSYETNRTFLTNAINTLPVYSPDENIWRQIEFKLDQKKSNYKQNRNRIFAWSAVAASLIIALGIWKVTIHNKPNEKFTYSEEEIAVEQLSEASDTLLNQFLAEQCAALPEECDSPRFTELNNKYQQLEEVQKTILKTLSENPGNENILASVRRIENDKIQLKKQLLKYFAS
ncbi:MAG: hypothetical protein ABI772_05645 [Bacteroidota bacterium]